MPNSGSRVCGCHFRDGLKENGPEIFSRNADKIFQFPDPEAKPPKPRSKPRPKKKKKIDKPKLSTVKESIAAYHREKQKQEQPAKTGSATLGVLKERSENVPPSIPITQVILQMELDTIKQDLKQQEEKINYQCSRYSASTVSAEALRMETGLPTKEVFAIVVNYAERFKDSIVYYAGWKVEAISFQDQIFITLMKLRQNYTNLHLAQLFHCSVSTISNIVTTFIHVLHKILFNALMTSIPSRVKNSL